MARAASVLALSFACTACDHFESPRASALPHRLGMGVRHLDGAAQPGVVPTVSDREALPRTMGFIICCAPASRAAILEAREDVASHVGRWWRLGDGAASVRVIDARGHTMRGLESGGMLFVAGEPGSCHLELRNELDVPAECVVSINGCDLLDGRSPSLLKTGVHLEARATKALPPFTFATISGPAAMLRSNLAALPGVICVAVYPSTGPAPRLPRALTRLPTGGPQRHYEPSALPYEYR